MPANNSVIDVTPQNSAFAALTPYYGGMCCEAAAFCLSENGHVAPKATQCQGVSATQVELSWTQPPVTAAATYRDRDVAAEHGAYAVAIALVNHLYGLDVIERSAKGTGFDFWMGESGTSELSFGSLARLEVSGIFNGPSKVGSRLGQKLDQMFPTDHVAVGYAVVAEFGAPTLAVGQKELVAGDD